MGISGFHLEGELGVRIANLDIILGKLKLKKFYSDKKYEYKLVREGVKSDMELKQLLSEKKIQGKDLLKALKLCVKIAIGATAAENLGSRPLAEHLWMDFKELCIPFLSLDAKDGSSPW